MDENPTTNGTLEISVGASYLILTKHYYYLGRVYGNLPNTVKIDNAYIVFETGNMEQAARTGKLQRCEKVGEAIIPVKEITALIPWPKLLVR